MLQWLGDAYVFKLTQIYSGMSEDPMWVLLWNPLSESLFLWRVDHWIITIWHWSPEWNHWTRSRPQSWSQSDLSPICLNPSSSQKSAVLYVWHRTPLHLNTLSCHPHVNQLQVLFRGPVSRRPRNHFRRLLVMPCMKACVYWCTCVCQHVFGSQRVGLTQGDGWQSKPECVPECVL